MATSRTTQSRRTARDYRRFSGQRRAWKTATTMKIFIEPESMITKKFLAGWYLAWLREAAEQAGLDPGGSKKELVDRIRAEVRKGNRRVIRRFDRCA